MVRVSPTVWMVCALVASSLVPSAQADYFGFSYNSGGHGGHYHHRHCAPGWGVSYGFFAPPPPRVVYVEPAPVIRERIYVQPPVVQERVIVPTPAPSYPASNSFSSNSLPTPPNRNMVDKPVVIRNGANKGATVAFIVDNRDEELSDGQSRTFSGSGNHTIEFDRGGDRGVARYELTGGVYSFVVTSNGWDLVRDTDTTRTAKQSIPRKNEIPGETTWK